MPVCSKQVTEGSVLDKRNLTICRINSHVCISQNECVNIDESPTL